MKRVSFAIRRSVDDWLTHARSAEDVAECLRCLEAAVSETKACHEWRGVLAAAAAMDLVPLERVAEIAERTLEMASAERDVWGFRDVASARASRLADVAGAKQALETCVALFQTPRTDMLGQAAAILGRQAWAHGYEWVLLGDGFALTLQDEEGRRRCLTLGRDSARARQDAGDLCDIASAWAESINRAEGSALLREAERLASPGNGRAWSLANAWRALGEEQEGRRVLDEALAARAGDRVDDQEAVAAVGSRGERPEDLASTRRRLDGWESSASALFDWLRQRIGDAQLTKIAKADYGMGADKNLAALRDIRDTVHIPRTLPGDLLEVLELTRWSTGETVDHVVRGFSCAILCLSPIDGGQLLTNGAILAESCLALGDEPTHLAERFFAWTYETDPSENLLPTPLDDADANPLIALLLLLILRAWHAPEDPRLEPLTELILAHPAVAAGVLGPWLASSMRAQLWSDLVSNVLAPLTPTRPWLSHLVASTRA